MKKDVIFVIVILLSFAALTVYCAEMAEKPATPPTAASRARHPNMIFLMGSISKIDTSDPANTKIEIVNDADQKTHLLELGPRPNIAKLIDVTELKTGERTRIVARKVNGKEMAVSVVTGKLRQSPMQKPGLKLPAVPTPQKEKTKK